MTKSPSASIADRWLRLCDTARGGVDAELGSLRHAGGVVTLCVEARAGAVPDRSLCHAMTKSPSASIATEGADW